MSDLLERATRASRQAPTPGPSPDETRARILATVRRESVKPPRRLRHGWSIPLVAALVATGAAAAVGTHPFAFLSSPAPAVSTTPAAPGASSLRASRPAVHTPDAPAEPPAESSTVTPTPTAPTTTAAPTTAAEAQPATSPAAGGLPAVVTSPPVATVPGGAPNTTAPASTAAGGAARTGSTPSERPVSTAAAGAAATGAITPDQPTAPATDDPAEALYREAHALHFRGGDAGAAVAAWERYLAAAPRGRFAPEARYNRALALLRAGRREEGLRALAPFASAPAGSYRQAEAQRLLDAAGQSRQDAPSTSPAHP